ncbi:hypothetical protein [Streptomyces sp. SP18CS02]|uniref:hypothetical protein n=1 Tax=Streptomyces sp. SP18CS02 TaxID=3002531 RepID=UPI002E78C2E7|nr:hypothetical protein [Streptomyces sp. SP18CS02]MEE1752090.1 hypothetical protein [Streptomyces sp. SP18CS02]
MVLRRGRRNSDDRATSAGLLALAAISVITVAGLLVWPGSPGAWTWTAAALAGIVFVVSLVNGVRPKRWTDR